jgi:hypothetical protein
MRYRLHKIFFSVAACCLSLHSAAAQDDLYFSPKRQKELDKQQAERWANETTIFGLKRGYSQEPQQQENYTESWGDVDSLGTRPNSKIYEISDSYDSSQDERDEDSYAARLRYDDPTYIVYDRTPYWYDPWWSYPSVGFYGTWGDRWGWGLSWSYPYYGWGWGYPHYYHHHYSPYYWGGYYPSYWGGHRHVAVNGTHRGSSMSGTGRGTGYTNNRSGSGTYSRQSMNVPSGTYTQRTQGGYSRTPTPQQGAGSTGANRTTYSNSGWSYQSIPPASSPSSSSAPSSNNSSSSSAPSSSYSRPSSSSSGSSYSRPSSSSNSRGSYSGSSSSGGRRSSGR